MWTINGEGASTLRDPYIRFILRDFIVAAGGHVFLKSCHAIQLPKNLG